MEQTELVEDVLAVGNAVIVRTVTHYYTGRIVARDVMGLTLECAAWIASTGRWANALSEGTLEEVEPFPNAVWISLGAIVDVSPWRHELPRKQR